MSATIQTFVLLSLVLSACARQQQAQTISPAAGKQVSTEGDAIAVVLADIERRGGDPRREECTAKKHDDGWYVIAWHIFYPENTGSSRFVPGGFFTYVVSEDGKILERQPGL